MTPEEAKAKQDEIVRMGFNLGWWYGTDCTPCCGVFPKFKSTGGSKDLCYFECPVCHKRTKGHVFPHLAEDAWNRGETFREKESEQLTLF